MPVQHPRWLRDGLLAEALPESWIEDDASASEVLTFACTRLCDGETEVSADHRDVSGVRVWFLDITSPLLVEDEGLADALAEAAEFVATSSRRAEVLSIRTGFVEESGAAFAEYVDRIANMPETVELSRLVSWLSVRCAEWRSKVAQLRSEVLAAHAEEARGGVSGDFDFSRHGATALVEAIRRLPPVRHFQMSVERARADLEAADTSLSAAHELLDAKAAALAQAASERLQTTSTWIGIAVALAGFGAVGGLLFDGNKGAAGLPVWAAVALTVAPAAFALSAFSWLYLRHQRRGLRDSQPGSSEAIEAELNALCEGSLFRVNGMHSALVPLKDRMGDAETLRVLRLFEAQAGKRLATIVSALSRTVDALDKASFSAPSE